MLDSRGSDLSEGQEGRRELVPDESVRIKFNDVLNFWGK